MIGVDTNVLLRLFVTDDREQHHTAVQFFTDLSRSSLAYIGYVVLVEFVWVLTRTYQVPRIQIIEAVAALMGKWDVMFENKEIVGDLLDGARRSQADLADLLIASTHQAAGCLHTVTFDRGAARLISNMKLVA